MKQAYMRGAMAVAFAGLGVYAATNGHAVIGGWLIFFCFLLLVSS